MSCSGSAYGSTDTKPTCFFYSAGISRPGNGSEKCRTGTRSFLRAVFRSRQAIFFASAPVRLKTRRQSFRPGCSRTFSDWSQVAFPEMTANVGIPDKEAGRGGNYEGCYRMAGSFSRRVSLFRSVQMPSGLTAATSEGPGRPGWELLTSPRAFRPDKPLLFVFLGPVR